MYIRPVTWLQKIEHAGVRRRAELLYQPLMDSSPAKPTINKSFRCLRTLYALLIRILWFKPSNVTLRPARSRMLQSIIVESPATYIMLLLCVLSVGFMILFLSALAIDGKKTARLPARPKEIWCPVDVINEERRSRKDAFNPASHLAMGVVRLTTALATKL